MTRRASLCLFVCALTAVAACGREEAPPVRELSGAVEVAATPARLNLLRQVVTAAGRITPHPDAEWTVHAAEPSLVAELPIAEGDPVEEGDIIVRFEVPTRTSQMQATDYEISLLTTRVEQARARADELAGLLARGLTARVDVDAARQELAAAETSLAAATATMSALRAAEARDTVRARFSGVLLKRWHYIGDLVMNTGQDPVLQIADPARMQITLDVPVSEVGKVMPGQRVTITTAGAAPIVSTVSVVLPVTGTDSGTTRVLVELPALPEGTAVAIDDTVLGEILIAEVTEALVVPTRAILRDTGTPQVFVVGLDGRVARRDLRLGVATPELTEVLDGLQAGEFVVTSGLLELADGDLVRVSGG